MPKHRQGMLRFAFWLLCVLVFSAAIDQLPDPPATKPQLPCANTSWASAAPDILPTTVEPVIAAEGDPALARGGVSDTAGDAPAPYLMPVVRYAADPSPPLLLA